MSIREKVLSRILPTTEEQQRLNTAVSELVERVNDLAGEEKTSFRPILVGSVAKSTHLADPDIDLFLRFPVDLSEAEMEFIGKKVGHTVLSSPEERYAEHPYVSGYWQGFRTDIVPCYDVPSGKGRISAVDRTPFHTEFVKANLSEGQRDEVRLLKQFAKGIEIYGAEAKIQGFSGYLCEILILRFGTFEALTRAASKWKPPVELALHQNETKKSFIEKFVFIDPVDPGRNVASPVSHENLMHFIDACRAYVKEPKETFFFPDKLIPLSDEDLSNALVRHPGMVIIRLPPLDVVDDVLWPQLRKTGTSIFEVLEREGFSPGGLAYSSDKTMNLILVDCRIPELTPSFLHTGPPERSIEVESFLRKWQGRGLTEPRVREGRWEVEVSREHRTPREFLTNYFHLVRLGKGFRKTEEPVIESGETLMRLEYREIMTRLLTEKRPWER